MGKLKDQMMGDIPEIEPIEGSVVMAHGKTGTAFQRWHSDGEWHGTNGLTVSWQNLQESYGITLVYSPYGENL